MAKARARRSASVGRAWSVQFGSETAFFGQKSRSEPGFSAVFGAELGGEGAVRTAGGLGVSPVLRSPWQGGLRVEAVRGRGAAAGAAAEVESGARL